MTAHAPRLSGTRAWRADVQATFALPLQRLGAIERSAGPRMALRFLPDDERVVVSDQAAVSCYSSDLRELHWVHRDLVADRIALWAGTVVLLDQRAGDLVFLDAATGALTSRKRTEAQGLVEAMTGDGSAILVATPSERVSAVATTTGAILWSAEAYGPSAVGLDDSFVVTARDGKRVARLSSTTGAVIWAFDIPGDGTEAVFGPSGKVTVVSGQDLVVKLTDGRLYRLSAQNGAVVATGRVSRNALFVVTDEEFIVAGPEGITVVDHGTMQVTENVSWREEVREACGGLLPDAHAVQVSRLCVVWATAGGELMGVRRPGARAGRRKVWKERIPGGMFFSPYSLVSAGRYLYAQPASGIGLKPVPPGICCYTSLKPTEEASRAIGLVR